MKPADNIEDSIRKLRRTTTAATDERILNDALTALGTHPQAGPAEKLKTQNLKLKTITVAAAVIIVAVLIAVRIFVGSSEDRQQRTEDRQQKTTSIEPRVSSIEAEFETKQAATKLEVELKDIEKMFAAGDVDGLVAMLGQGRFITKMFAAKYLGQIGDERALPVLEKLNLLATKSLPEGLGQSAYGGFAEAIANIKTRLGKQKRDTQLAEQPSEPIAEPNEADTSFTIVKVIDEQNNPVKGAVITPDGLRSKKDPGSHYAWFGRVVEPVPVTTNAEGIAEVAYPRYVGEKLQTGAISFQVGHPEFCRVHPMSFPVDGSAEPIVLEKGAILKVSGYIGSEDNVVMQFYPQVSSRTAWFDRDSWNEIKKGILVTKQLTPGLHYLRVVHFPEQGRTCYSDAILFHAEKGEYKYHLELKPGIRIEGRLDESVPRPVQSGRVVARAHPVNPKTGAGILKWSTWRSIREDGTFVFESLPPGEVELIALCDGFISKNPPQQTDTHFGIPQVFPLNGDLTQMELVMEPTAACEVRVVDEQEQPIEGARVFFWPNVRWNFGGTQIFAQFLIKWEDFLLTGGKFDREKAKLSFEQNDFQAITDEHGVAVIYNLPGSKQNFNVISKEYELPARTLYGSVRRRVADANLVAGETTMLTVVMQKKGTEFLGEAGGEDLRETTLRSGISTCEMDVPSEFVGVVVEGNDSPSEFVGVVVDENDNPLEGVLVDAWTWYPGNETHTDANGFFRLAGFKDQKTIEVRISKENYSPKLYVRQPLGVEDAVVILGNKTYFKGQIRSSDGEPVTGAIIRASQDFKAGKVWTETIGDEQGYYRLYVQNDKYDIQVKADGIGVARMQNVEIGRDEVKQLDIVLDSGVVFLAEIVDSLSGEPVEGVRLFHWQHPGVEGVSDANGLVEIGGMMPGRFEFNVDSRDCVRWWSAQCLSEWNRFKTNPQKGGWQRNFDSLDFDLKVGMKPATIIVEQGVRIRGMVFDPYGNPVSGATVAPALTGTGNSITGDTRFSFLTEEDGSFEMLLPAGKEREYNLIVHDGKYQQWRNWANGVMQPIQTEPGEELNDIELWLSEPVTVRGRVKDRAGQPVIGRKVRSSAFDKLGNRYYDPTAETDEDGYFELKFIRPGKHYIQVAPFWLSAEDAPQGTSLIVTLEASQTIDGIELVAEDDRAF
jgi:protocatechuate 3,4-dioxygenase beta subunit